MNSAIRTFEKYAINGENGGMCTVHDLKNVAAENFQILLDDILTADVDKRIFAQGARVWGREGGLALNWP